MAVDEGPDKSQAARDPELREAIRQLTEAGRADLERIQRETGASNLRIVLDGNGRAAAQPPGLPNAGYDQESEGRDLVAFPSEDASVQLVEDILRAATARVRQPVVSPRVTHALWVCACVTLDDAPTWLILAHGTAAVAWRRVTNDAVTGQLDDAQFVAGGHADPAEVLRWLQNAAPDPWAHGGYGQGDDSVVPELHRRISALVAEQE